MRIVVFVSVLIIFALVIYLTTFDLSLTIVLVLTGSIVISAVSMPTIKKNMHLDQLDRSISTLGRKKMITILKGYNLQKVSELDKFEEVKIFFVANTRKHDTTEYLGYMSKSLIISGILYAFLTIAYIISFVSTNHPHATPQEMLASKFGYTMAYMGITLGYVCYYISPILLYSRKNNSIVH